MLFLSAPPLPSSLQSDMNTIAYLGLFVMAGALGVGIVAFSLARSRGYLGAGIAGSRRIFAALLGIFALGAINVIIAAVMGHI